MIAGARKAILSACKAYRYYLQIGCSRGLFADYAHDSLVVIMCNPSTADEQRNDPTVSKMIRYAERERCRMLEVLNVYAFRATDPAELKTAPDPVGPRNDHLIEAVAGRRDALLVAAWGAIPFGLPGGPDRIAVVKEILKAAAVVPVQCLGQTYGGHPKHPLYLPNTAPLMRWGQI
jgi:hypothetical protein